MPRVYTSPWNHSNRSKRLKRDLRGRKKGRKKKRRGLFWMLRHVSPQIGIEAGNKRLRSSIQSAVMETIYLSSERGYQIRRTGYLSDFRDATSAICQKISFYIIPSFLRLRNVAPWCSIDGRAKWKLNFPPDGLEISRFNYLYTTPNYLWIAFWISCDSFLIPFPPSKWISKLDRTFHSIWLVRLANCSAMANWGEKEESHRIRLPEQYSQENNIKEVE